jgi:dipeptidyl aminopeptidase/acylaminoacyl peptidase
MEVVNQTTGRVWTVPCALFKECSVITPVKWSTDNGTLFFAPEAVIFEAPIGIKLYTAVAKIDMETGAWEKVLEETDRYYDFAVSNDDAYLAYTQPKEKFGDNKSVILSVLNLKNGRETKYSLDGFLGGNFVWSPYTTRFVFQIQDPAGGSSSILYYDVNLDVLKYVIQEEKKDFHILSWGEDNLVSLRKFSWTDRSFSDWVLNPFTNELSPASTHN